MAIAGGQCTSALGGHPDRPAGRPRDGQLERSPLDQPPGADYAGPLETRASIRWTSRPLAIGACALSLTACGDSPEKSGLNKYFRQVSAVQRAMLLPLSRIDQAYRAFSLQPRSAGHELPALTNAQQALVLLRARLAALHPPGTALRLQGLLLHLVDLEVTTARELRGTAAYLPASQHALAPLAQANLAFRRRFAASRGAVAQADALDAYAADVARVDAAYHRLDPPALLRPSAATQRATLIRVRRLAIRLAAALRAHDRAAVARLVPRFRAAAAPGDGGAQARAIRAYNARVRAISRTTTAIQRERVRLERRFG